MAGQNEQVAIELVVRDLASTKLDTVERNLKDLERTAKQTGSGASQGLNKIDQGADGASKALHKIDRALDQNRTSFKQAESSVAGASSRMNRSLDTVARAGRSAGTQAGAGLVGGVRGANVAGEVERHGGRMAAAAERSGRGAGRRMGGGMMNGFLAAGAVVFIGKQITGAVDAYTGMAAAVNGLKRTTGDSTEDASRLRTQLELSGVAADKGGTALKIFSKNLGNAATDGKKTAAMAQLLGADFRDATGHVKPMSEILPALSDKFKAMPNGAEKTALAMKLFGKSGTDMLPFLNKGSDGLADLAKKSDELGLTLDDTAIKKMGDAKVQQREFAASIQGAKIALGGALLPAMTMVQKFITTYFVPGMALLVGYIKENSSWITPLAAGLAGLFAVVKVGNGIIGAFNLVLNANPVVKVIAIIAALVIALKYAYDHFEGFRKIVDQAWSFIQEKSLALWHGVLEPAFNWIKDNIHYVGDAAIWLWNNAIQPAFAYIAEKATWLWQTVLLPALGWIRDNIHVVGDAATWLWVNAIQPAFTWIAEKATWLWQTVLQPVFKAWWDYITKFLIPIITWLWSNVVSPVFGFIADKIAWAWKVIIQPTLSALWAFIQNVLIPVIQWLWNNVVSPIFGFIADKISWAWNSIIQPVFGFLDGGIQGVGKFFSDLWATVSDVWGKISSWIGDRWTWIRDNVFGPIGSAIETVKSVFDGLWTKVREIWDNIWGKIQGVWQGADGKGGIKGIWDKIQEFAGGVKAFFEGIVSGISDAVGKITGFISDVFNAIKGFFTNTVQWDQNQIKDQMNAPGQQTSPLGGGNPTATAPTGNPFLRDGGPITGHGGPRSDNIPVWASPGEFVVNAKATRENYGLINAINESGKYADGGLIKNASDRATNMIGDILWRRTENLVGAERDKIMATAGATANLAAFTDSQDPSSFGWVRAANQQGFSWNGLSTTVAGGTQGLWSALLNGLAPAIIGGITSIGGFENRDNVNNPGVPSFHSYGLAMDVNAPENPNGVSAGSIQGQFGAIPIAIAEQLASRLGMLWGGDFRGTPDPMHFEIHVPPNAINGATITGGLEMINQAVGGLLGSSGGGVEQWRSTALAALAAAGQPSGYINSLLKQMDHESSGRPAVVNTTDSNAQAGTPSIGLMQVVWPTFVEELTRHGFGVYVSKGLTDPFSNILAGILHTVDTYGDLGYWARNNWGPYDTGGFWPSGTGGVNTSGRDEFVLNPDQTAALKRGNLGGGKHINVEAGAVQIVVQGELRNAGQVRAELERALREILSDDAARRY